MHKIVYVKTQSGKQYMYLGDKESFKIGDIVSNDKHDNMTVINVFDSEKDTYNGHPIKQLISKKNMKQNGMFGGIVDKYKSQFIPQKENDVKMSLNGILCVPIDGEYVGIGADNELTAFTPEMVIDIPVYSIRNKCQGQWQRWSMRWTENPQIMVRFHFVPQLIFINSFLVYYINYKCIFELSTC